MKNTASGKQNRKRLRNIEQALFNFVLAVIASSVLIITGVWAISEYLHVKKRTEFLIEKHKADQKLLIKKQVESVIHYLDFVNYFRYDEDVDKTKTEALEYISSIRMAYGGYVFVNKIDGQALVFDGQKVDTFKNISNLTDPTGKRLFDFEREAYFDPNGRYMEYLFKRMDNDVPEPKISFFKGYPEWEWIIGAGIYVTQPDTEIEIMRIQAWNSFGDTVKLILIITLILILTGYIAVRNINRGILLQILHIQKFLKNAARSKELLNTEKLLFREIYDIGVNVNKMTTETRQLTEKVVESQEELQSIFDAAQNIGLIITDINDLNTAITNVNKGAELIFGYEKSELINSNLTDLIKEEQIKFFIELQKDLLNNKGFSGEAILKRKDESEFDALLTIHPLKKANKVIGAIGVVVDISKRKKAENELNQIKDNLEKIVEKRTKELEKSNAELLEKNEKLTHFNKLFVDRELRIKELKDKVKELQQKLNKDK